ncbi:MAG: AEC family transporter [Desulfobacterales bacterium]|nr:AEC family transporter [Desulfobacterales bacterium]
MDNFILTISYLLIGMVLKRLPAFPRETANSLNLFVIYVSLPALILIEVPKLAFSKHLLVPTLMPWIMVLTSALIVLLLSRIMGWHRNITGALMLLVPLGNTSFLGIPMVQAFFGRSGVPYAVVYDQLGSFLAFATYGSVVLALYSGGEKPGFMNILLRILSFPPFIALLAGFMFAGNYTYPSWLDSLLASLASTLVPVVMIAVGFQLTLKLDLKSIVPLGIGLLLKLVVAPMTALLICLILKIDSEAARVSVFEAGMPPMVSAGALAIIAGLSPRLTAALVGLGIVASFFTLPILYNLL